jgi:tetratricopeptide (TPR) repeat protein
MLRICYFSTVVGNKTSFFLRKNNGVLKRNHNKNHNKLSAYFSSEDNSTDNKNGHHNRNLKQTNPPNWPRDEDIRKAANPHWREEAADDLLERGSAALLNNKYNDAADCFRESLHVIGKVDELKFSASAKNSLNALGIIHLLRGDLTLARERLDHAFKLQDNISKSGFGDDSFRDRAGLLNDYAALEMHDGNLDAAFKLLKQCSYTIGRAHKISNLSHSVTFANMGEYFYLTGEFDSSVTYFEKSCLHLRECSDGGNVRDFLGSNIRATVQTSMAKSLRSNLLKLDNESKTNDDDIQLANDVELQTCRTLLSEASYGLDNDSGKLNYIYIRSQQASLAWVLNEHEEARDYFFDAYFTSLKIKDQGVVDNEIFLIAQNNASLFHHDVNEAEKLLTSCLDILEVETIPSKIERMNVIKNVVQHNLHVLKQSKSSENCSICNDSIPNNSKLLLQPYCESFQVDTNSKLLKLNHSNYILGSGIIANPRASEFSFSGNNNNAL